MRTLLLLLFVAILAPIAEASPRAGYSAELGSTAVSGTKAVLVLDGTGASDAMPDECRLGRLSISLDTIATAATVNFFLAADSAGDVPVSESFSQAIAVGKTTNTDGGVAVDLGGTPYRITDQSTSDALWLVVWLDAGTANATARLTWETY